MQQSEALAALEAWMSKFRRVARVALEEHPHQLTALGF